MAIINNFPVSPDPDVPCMYIGGNIKALVWPETIDQGRSFHFVCNAQTAAYSTPTSSSKLYAAADRTSDANGTYYVKITETANSSSYSLIFGGSITTSGTVNGYGITGENLTVGSVYKVVIASNTSSVYGPDGTLLGEYSLISSRPKNIAYQRAI